MLLMLSAATASASDFVVVTCVDISSSPATSRVLELAATSVNEKYFSLAGSHKNPAGATVGSAVGTALLGSDELIVTVNASSAVNDTMKATLYQFNFDASTFIGTFRSITQENINGTFTPLDFKSGEAALVSCDAPVTEFSGSPAPDPGTDPDPDPGTDPGPDPGTDPGPDPGTDPIIYDADKDFVAAPLDCNDNDRTINPRVPEICGDGIDQNCNGNADDVCGDTGGGDTGGDSYPTFTDNRNGTLSQVGTNLIWKQNHFERTEEGSVLNWYSAKDYCDNLNFAGATNWRLPTKAELLAIVDNRKSPVKIDPLFTDAKATYYWTSTAYSPYETWDVHFGTGLAGVRGKQTTVGLTRCVR
jgi:hypothetical protein